MYCLLIINWFVCLGANPCNDYSLQDCDSNAECFSDQPGYFNCRCQKGFADVSFPLLYLSIVWFGYHSLPLLNRIFQFPYLQMSPDTRNPGRRCKKSMRLIGHFGEFNWAPFGTVSWKAIRWIGVGVLSDRCLRVAEQQKISIKDTFCAARRQPLFCLEAPTSAWAKNTNWSTKSGLTTQCLRD